MESQVKLKQAFLYDTDYQLWLKDTVTQLKARNFGDLDLDNLIEEIEGLGKSDKRAILSYLLRLCEHLLKLKHWESERESCFRGWILEINNFRAEIDLILQDSPSLKSFIGEAFEVSYQKARKNMLKAISLPTHLISQVPDFTLEQALDEDWLPWTK
ncbi:MAG: DUF29 domain-containing protein [Oscillatoriales cyanobacterium SM2_1_8]|nr:DUF29 domain-containing protein [Oscillatoriales cyanobacterium SM2_1_8]